MNDAQQRVLDGRHMRAQLDTIVIMALEAGLDRESLIAFCGRAWDDMEDAITVESGLRKDGGG